MQNSKIRLVVIDENILGYIHPEWHHDSAGILSSLITKGANVGLNQETVFTRGKSIRLASEKDFEAFRVSFSGYKNDPEFMYAK